MRALNATTIAVALALSLALAALLHYRVDEVDVFWQLRAGEEIAHGLGVQHVDTWSHTRAGAPWHNFQWLSCVLLFLVSKLGGAYKYLPTLRMLGAALVLALASAAARFSLSSNARHPAVAMALAVAACFAPMLAWLRLQPELFALACFAALLVAWSCPEASPRARVATSLAVLVLWANLHSGSVAVGAAFTAAFMLFSGELRALPLSRRLGLAVAAILCCLLSPVGWHGPARLASLVLLYDWEVVRNPAQASFSFDDLRAGDEVATHRIWLFFTLAINATYLLLWRRKLASNLPPSHARPGLFAALSLALTAGAAYRLRVRPYQALYYVPVVAAAISLAQERLSRLREGARQALTAMAFLALTVGSGLMIKAAFADFDPGGPGFGILAADFPGESLEFIRRERPRGAMHNTWKHGGYLVQNLREYPVLFDSREEPFMGVFQDRNTAFIEGEPEIYEAYHHKYGVNFAIVPATPATLSRKGPGYFDTWEPVFPRKAWALVFFDNTTQVFVRRIPEHADLIARNEFKALRHGLPAFHYAYAAKIPGDVRLTAEVELNRCLNAMPRNVYCRWGKAAFHASRGERPAAMRELRAALNHVTSESERAELLMTISEGLERARAR